MNDTKELPDDAIDAVRAAQLLQGSRSLVYRMIEDGRLRAWKIAGTRMRVSEAEVKALIAPVEPRHVEGPRTAAQAESAGRSALARLRARGYRA